MQFQSEAAENSDSDTIGTQYRLLWTVHLPNAIHLTATDHGKLMTLVTGKRRSLLVAGDDDKMFMTRSLNLTLKTTGQHLIVRCGKSEA